MDYWIKFKMVLHAGRYSNLYTPFLYIADFEMLWKWPTVRPLPRVNFIEVLASIAECIKSHLLKNISAVEDIPLLCEVLTIISVLVLKFSNFSQISVKRNFTTYFKVFTFCGLCCYFFF